MFGFLVTYRLLMREGGAVLWSICEFDAVVGHIVLKIILASLNTIEMKNTSKKNNHLSSNKKTQTNSKGLKRSKSTQYLIPKRTPKKNPVEKDISEENILTHSLAKSKSAKSIKTKPKSQHKRQNVPKKTKVKRMLSPQPTKKQVCRQSHENSSVLSDILTKKPQQQFFFYGNSYIPIENSAQRRLVFRIQKIDLENKLDEFENKATADTFLKNETQQRGISTQNTQTNDTAVGDAFVKANQEGIQTEVQKKIQYQQSAQKCFADVLTELEFLYMPNQANFQPFTKEERLHYGQMLEAIAKKMLSCNRNIVSENQSVLSEDQVTVLLYQRQGIQVGALDHVPSEGFPTHLLAILAYLKNLFCFIDYNYKEEVITNLRSFYGLNYNQRVSRLSLRLPHEKDKKYVLNEEIFQVFEHQMFKDYDFGSDLVKQAVHIHNKAIFDAVNHELQVFRPFFSSEGEPFPWTINLGMTHYDITEEALYIIFMQVKEKIQKMVTTLCGMHLDFDDNDLPSAHKSPFYRTKIHEKIEGMAVEEMKNFDDRVQLDYQRTLTNFELQQQIFFELVSELEQEMLTLRAQAQLQSEFDFQFSE